ncbi:MAG TPA: isocitrate/isopropylmalate dehydrogenase family protein [Rubrobacteraceae bacterium]|nr:isocitrate/isopropylmalate dehydrogenase family protein [Rubrobacteraceae bacterium]
MAQTITMIPGDGIGPDVTNSVQEVIEALGVDIEWEIAEAGETVMEEEGTPLPESVLESIRRNKIAIKGPLTTPVGAGFRSVNVALRKELDLYANVRPALSMPGINMPFENIDIITFRENTEDVYAGIEHMVGQNAAESIKIITREGTERLCRLAFEQSKEWERKRITVVHKANIMKETDGLFRDVFFEVSKDYENDFEEIDDRIVDNMAMQLVQKPNEYDVLVCPNLYGDIISDECAGLTGGLGVAPGANIGDGLAVFEPVHGSTPKYAGQNRANPLATLRSAKNMLDYMGLHEDAERMQSAIEEALKSPETRTKDLGGSAGTKEFAQAVISHL